MKPMTAGSERDPGSRRQKPGNRNEILILYRQQQVAIWSITHLGRHQTEALRTQPLPVCRCGFVVLTLSQQRISQKDEHPCGYSGDQIR
jgi:hypothetical protein